VTPHHPDLRHQPWQEIKGKKIAVEVELSVKGQRRLESIIDFYTKNFHYDEVLYFVEREDVRRALQKVTKGLSFVKIESLKDWITD
jgi:hypothetical protein